MNIYEKLGVRIIVNAKGPATRVSGGIMRPEVGQAIVEATQYCVDMTELQARASEIIVEYTGAESGIVTAGAAAGLLLGTAACIAGLDPAKMNRLPDVRGLKNEVIVVRSQRNFYDHAVRATGARLVEVGIADRFSGAGVRDTDPWEIADAISDRTACIYYVAAEQSRPVLSAVTAIAREAAVPVLVDAAAQLPPVVNLRRFIEEGADLVALSGGKAILGPQSSGLLFGRRDLIASAILQNLDQDLFFEQWRAPPGIFRGIQLRGLPQHGIGRACKVGKEQVVGALVALKSFVEEDLRKRHVECKASLNKIIEILPSRLRGHTEIVQKSEDAEPILYLELDSPTAALDLVVALQDGEPCIHADPTPVDDSKIAFSALCLREGQEEVIGRRLNELLI